MATSTLAVSVPRPLAAGVPPPAAPAVESDRGPARRTTAEDQRRRGLRQELGARLVVISLVLLFNETFPLGPRTAAVIRLTGLVGLGLNALYLVTIRWGRALRGQAYVRTAIDVGLITAGLFGAGGLGAAQYLGLYAVVPVYAAIVFSSLACAVAVVLATVAYVVMVALQLNGILPFIRPPLPDAWVIAAFNLLALNLIGWLAALLADAYRASRRDLAAAYAELEQAHDESLRVNAQIQRASHRYVLSEVVTGVTHEIRDALQGAFGHLWLARRAPSLTRETLEQLGQAEQACERAMRILSTTLDMARLPTVEREPVAVADIVQRVANLKTVELRRDHITLVTDIPAGLPRVAAAPFQLQQVLVNLVANAQDELRTVPPGRREITIVGKETPEGVAVEVRDSGGGIPPKHLPHIFEPFYTTRTGASGLGLAISAGVVDSLGGRLTVENRREGGALFRLTLPPAPAPAAPAPAATAPTTPS